MTAKIKKSLTKKEIVNSIRSTIGFSTLHIENITDDIIDSLIDILMVKKKVTIKNFGSFSIIFKKQREGRNPKTKEKFVISSRNSVSFKSSNYLKKRIVEL